MTKRYYFLISLIFFIGVIWVVIPIIRNNYRYDYENKEIVKVKTSEVYVSSEDSLLINSIQIFCNTSEHSEPIFASGKRTDNQLLMYYGPESFDIYYNDTLVGECGIHKYNWWQDMSYSFHFYTLNDSLKYEFNVDPIDSVGEYYKR